MDTKQAGMG